MPLQRHPICAALLVTVMLSSLMGGCADGPMEDSDNSLSESALLAEAPFENGGSLRFYEPEPGVLITFEQSPTGAAREQAPGEELMNEAERFTLLTGQPAPSRLVAAAAAVSDVRPSRAQESLVEHASGEDEARNKGLTGADISRPGPREDFLRLYCTKTDRFYWHLGYDRESLHSGDGINYYAWGVNAIQGPTVFKMNVQRYVGEQPLEAELPQGWYAGAVVKVGGAGAHISSFAKPRAPGALFDHCVNYHY